MLEHLNGKIRGYVGDITNRDFIMRAFTGVDIVFHTAALKHVILGERSPDSIVETNIIGLQNVLDASLANNVEKFIFTSSDKAVNPTNVMGTSKLMGERLVTATNSKKKGQKTLFCSTRFGNVIGSRGSVFPIFREQIMKGGPVTLTDREMTRFIMTIEEAAGLIIESSTLTEGGEVFVTKMPVIRIEDLAKVMIEELSGACGHDPKDVKIKLIGPKPGEKLYEELMSGEETKRSYEFDRFFSILPAFSSVYEDIGYSYLRKGNKVSKPYISASEKPLSKKEIRDFLHRNRLTGC